MSYSSFREYPYPPLVSRRAGGRRKPPKSWYGTCSLCRHKIEGNYEGSLYFLPGATVVICLDCIPAVRAAIRAVIGQLALHQWAEELCKIEAGLLTVEDMNCLRWKERRR